MRKFKSLNESGVSILEVLVGIIISGLIVYFIMMLILNMKHQEKKEIIKSELLFQSFNIMELFTSDPPSFLDNLSIYYEVENDRIMIKINSSKSSYLTFTYEVVKNDKNYRLAPPDEVTNKDYRLRYIFSRDYNYYKDVIYKKYIDGIKKKIDKETDDFSCSKSIEEEKWNNLKRLELDKIEFLNDAKRNLNVLNQQNKDILNGTLYFHKDENGNDIEEIEIYKYEFMNRIIPCNVQLAKSGYANNDIKNIEDKFLYQRRIRSYGVGLRHISNNISDVKDYMLSCKLAYTNRVCISPDKNGVNMNILEYIDYSNPKHIEAILYMQGNEISYESDMRIISYDITNMWNLR